MGANDNVAPKSNHFSYILEMKRTAQVSSWFAVSDAGESCLRSSSERASSLLFRSSSSILSTSSMSGLLISYLLFLFIYFARVSGSHARGSEVKEGKPEWLIRFFSLRRLRHVRRQGLFSLRCARNCMCVLLFKSFLFVYLFSYLFVLGVYLFVL